MCQNQPGKCMLQYIKCVVGIEVSCTVYLNHTSVSGNKGFPGSLDSTEVQLINNKNSFFFFFKEEVAMKSYICSLNSNMEKGFPCFTV